MLEPPCKEAGRAHEWYQGTLSRWCLRCFVVLPSGSIHKRAPDRVGSGMRKVTTGRRRETIARDGLNCRYCGKDVVESQDVAPNQLTIDHVVPLVAGGTKTVENLVVACYACNHKKGDATEGWVLLPVPEAMAG